MSYSAIHRNAFKQEISIEIMQHFNNGCFVNTHLESTKLLQEGEKTLLEKLF